MFLKSNNLFAHRIDLIKIMNEEKLYSSVCVSKQVGDIPNNDKHKNRVIQLGLKPLVNFNSYHL